MAKRRMSGVSEKSYVFVIAKLRDFPRAAWGRFFVLCALLFVWHCADNPASAPRPLPLSIGCDTVVLIHDSLKISLSAPEAVARGVKYLWFIDVPRSVDTASDSVVAKVFSIADTGRHCVVARAIDKKGTASLPDTAYFTVGYRRPVLTLRADTAVAVGARYALGFSGAEGDSRISEYQWYIDDPQKRQTTVDTVLSWTWGLADTGRRVIVAQAIDGDGVRSYPDSLVVRVTFLRPVVQPLSDTSVKVNDTLELRVSASDPVSHIVKYRYYFDTPAAAVTTTDSVLRAAWPPADTGRHVFVVTAISADSVESYPDTVRIAVTYQRPHVRLLADSVAATSDTVRMMAQASDADGRIDHYLWSIDGIGTLWITTRDSLLSWVFGGLGESFHTVRLIAVDNDGFASTTDSVRIHVILKLPVVRLGAKDTAVYINQNLKLKAMVVSTISPIAHYRWMIDGRQLSQSASSDTVTLRWGVAEAGSHLISLTAVDVDSLESLPDTMLVKVSTGSISIAPLHDTTISSLDTLRITCKASSGTPGDTAVNYFWNFSGSAAWEDSTSTPSHTLVYGGRGTVKVTIGARDNIGFLAVASFTVTFNRPPDSIMVTSPAPADTFVLTQRVPSCVVPFAYSASDPDNDSIVYSLSWGSAADSLSLAYQGKNQAFSVTVTRPGQYFWRLTARDAFGQTRTKSGTVIVVREYRICFIGHSIIVGMMGDGIVGGFRGGVLDSLRKTLGKYERLKAVGPYTTPFMSRSLVDDSCMAISGTMAREIYFMLMYDWPKLSADIWVLMIGVNGEYTGYELSYTPKLMDLMISRNMGGRLYVLNGTPLTPDMVTHNNNLPYFNWVIADAIQARDSVATFGSQRSHVFQVDAFAAMTKGGLLDSTLIADNVHPTQEGYNRLRDAIVAAMKKSNPFAIPKNP